MAEANVWSPELETLDQLLGGDMPLTVIRTLFPNEGAYLRGVHTLLAYGDVRLLSGDGTDIPEWRWRELFKDGRALNELTQLRLQVTAQGANRMS